MKRLVKAVGFMLLGALCLLLVLGYGIYRFAAPETHGLSPEDFIAEDREHVAVSDVIEHVNASAPRPNIVLILADDLGYGDVGAYGGTVIATPNMDRVAHAGVRFTQAYASASICSPSRAGLLTGRYPLRSGIMTAMQMAGDSFSRKASYQAGIGFAQFASVDMLGGKNAVLGLPPSEITLPEALGEAGYQSMAIGKWHLGDFTVWPEYHPMAQGFDEFVGFNGSNDDFPVAYWRREEEMLKDIGAEQAQYTGLFTDEAVGFIERNTETPFFLYLAHKDPHLPFYPSEDFAGQSKGGPYGDAVEELDASVGRILDTLEKAGIGENTIVIVTSDNGPWFDGSPGSFRGRKGQSYEGGFRVPLLVQWPEQIDSGTVVDTPTMNIDFYPTLLALAGLSLPEDRVIDGQDLGGLITGETTALDERPLFFFHHYDVEGVRQGDWKYYGSTSHFTWPVPLDKPSSFFGKVGGMRDYYPEGSDEPIKTLGTWPNLYDLQGDPGEAYDVKEKYPAQVDRLGGILAEWKADFYANPRGWQ